MFSAIEEGFMRRCLTLARYGLGAVKTNPMVGCVVVYKKQIIGEGFHEYYGGLHAERNALLSVAKHHESLLGDSTIYVSLEPCNHQGKTPPCTEIILEKGIKKVVIAQLDPNPKMSGKSIDLLKAKGINVRVGLLQEEAQMLNKHFIINQKLKRPYVILKYAESKDGYIGKKGKQIWLSNQESKRLTHKWRSEYDALLVGTNTAIIDNPQLTTRLYPGQSPIRILIDRNERVPKSHHLIADDSETIIYTLKEDYTVKHPNKSISILPDNEGEQLKWLLQDLYRRGIGTVMIEGGKQVLSNIIMENLWDEARIIKTQKKLETGIRAPMINGNTINQLKLGADKIIKITSLDLKKKLIG